jgi:hypothetical protein
VVTVWISGVDLREFTEIGRSTGTFNNPNQLGYFSVCLLSLTYLLYRHGELSYRLATLIFIASLFLAIASLSKAAMVANFAVIFLALKPSGSRVAVALWAGLVPIGLSLAWWLLSTGAMDDYLFKQRLASMAYEADSSLQSRGYLAFLQGDASQLLLGLGTTEVIKIVGHEVHSTLGSILNSYGLLGLMIFGGAMLIWARDLWRAYGLVGLVCIAGPAMLYGITHNGVRFTIFWLLFASSLAMARREGAQLANSSRVPVGTAVLS